MLKLFRLIRLHFLYFSVWFMNKNTIDTYLFEPKPSSPKLNQTLNQDNQLSQSFRIEAVLVKATQNKAGTIYRATGKTKITSQLPRY